MVIELLNYSISRSKNKILKNKNFGQLNCHFNDTILKASQERNI